MIDTVRGRVARPWLKGILENPPEGWEIREGSIMDHEGNTRPHRTAWHIKTGLWLKGDDISTHVIQVSLPRLVFDENIQLLKSQEDIDHGIQKMRILMREVMEIDCIPRWTRIDMVWNFKGNINDYIACFQNSKHPRVRSAVRVYQGESISWKGKQVEIQIYDKLKEKGATEIAKDGETIVRAEIRQKVSPDKLHSKGQEQPFSLICEPCLGGYKPNFAKAYTFYRNSMVQLSPKSIPLMCSRSPMDFIAYLQADQLTDTQGVPLVDIYLRGKSRATKYRTMREIKNRVIQHKYINFHQILPEEEPPIPVDRSSFKVA